MDYKGALLKGLKVIPSSSSIKSKPRQPQRKTNPSIKSKPRQPQRKTNPSIKSKPRQPQRKTTPNWLNLPPDVMVLIMQRVDWFHVLLSVKEVCKYWHEISKDPSTWRFMEFNKGIFVEKLTKIDAAHYYFGEFTTIVKLDKAWEKMVMHAIDLSSGQLQDLCLQDFSSDNLLQYIYQRSSQLRRLRLEYCPIISNDHYRHDFGISKGGLIGMLRNLPLLEELQFAYTWIPRKCIEVAGRHCPRLKSLSINERVYMFTGYPECDVEALAIANNMPTLRHLQLFGNRMTSEGLEAILKNCNHLEYLDLRQCYNLVEVLEKADFGTKLRQQIKHVRFPWDSTEDYEFDDAIYDSDGTSY